MSRIAQHLAHNVLILDGAMGTATHALDLSLETDFRGKENCTEILNLTRPDAIQSIHESFLAVGSHGVETNTFGGAPHVLAEFDLADQAFEINKTAALIARNACNTFATAASPRFVVGSMGPGTKLVTLGNITYDDLYASYHQQVSGLISGGVDALLIETCQDLLQIKCAIAAALAALSDAGKSTDDIPILVSVTIETTGTMLLGSEIAAVVNTLKTFPILSLGLNCATGPAEMAAHIRYLAENWDRHISVLPNAGLPRLEDGYTVFPLSADEFAENVTRFITENHVTITGGCCGTTPEHIGALVKSLASVKLRPRGEVKSIPGCASLYSPVDYRQDASILNVGERTNSSGSRAFKRMLEAEAFDDMVSLAREQVRDGSHLIDINVDYAGRDNAADMSRLIHLLSQQVNVPLMLDSTQSATIEAGLKQAGGKCIINSANLENGEDKFADLCKIARKYGAGLVLGAIDEDPEDAMARTADRKLDIVKRMHDLAVNKYQLAEEDLFFDPLVLPISTGMDKDRRSALETIEGTRRIARTFPNCQIIAGLSNVSFGLKPAARQVLNSVFLAELIDAGLTSAIVHVSKIQPKNRIGETKWQAALDLIYDRRDESADEPDPLQRFIALFDDDSVEQEVKEDIQSLAIEEQLQRHIIDGEKQNLIKTLDTAREKYSPLDIINDHLLAGMKVVGELFGSGQMQLPFVLQSAEVMKMAVNHLEQFMDKADGKSKGSIVLATVKGDVHDIGKNLVDIILTNNGYTVHNLGIKQPIADIVDQYRSLDADAIGLSGLLVKSVNVMHENLIELNEQGINIPVLLGGAALSRHYCENDLRNVYHGPLYYGKDAFDGLRIMNKLTSDDSATLDREINDRLAKRAATEKTIAASASATTTVAEPATIDTDAPAPTPPFYGDRIDKNISLDNVFEYINTASLFRGQWQFKKGSLSDTEYQSVIDNEVLPIFEQLKAQCKDEQILSPQVVYGYYPCNSDGDDLVIYDPDDHDKQIERFTFPRQAARKRLCIADFYKPIASGEKDTFATFCVTMGPEVSERAKQLFESDNYTQYLYLHGLGVESAEALAELTHKKIRTELGIAGDDKPTIRELFTQGYRGSRYSFGYPACPDMADQAKLFGLLRPQRIGCTLTENHQIDPEQSTSAIIAHHPQAKYFNV